MDARGRHRPQHSACSQACTSLASRASCSVLTIVYLPKFCAIVQRRADEPSSRQNSVCCDCSVCICPGQLVGDVHGGDVEGQGLRIAPDRARSTGMPTSRCSPCALGEASAARLAVRAARLIIRTAEAQRGAAMRTPASRRRGRRPRRSGSGRRRGEAPVCDSAGHSEPDRDCFLIVLHESRRPCVLAIQLNCQKLIFEQRFANPALAS